MRVLRLRPALIGGALLLLLVGVAGIGALHSAAGRRLMVSLGIPCPVQDVSAAQVAQLREAGTRSLRGVQRAPTKVALGMELGQSTRADLLAWSARSGAACVELVRGYSYLRCRGVPASALGAQGPALSEVWFSFAPDNRLIGVDLYRRGMDNASQVQAWNDARDRMAHDLGQPLRAVGDPSPAVLRASALQTARLEYRYSDLLATLTAANLPQAGLAVREQYVLAN